MAHDVFISYASADLDIAVKACSAMETKGIRCWMAPRDVQPGSDYGASLLDAIAESSVMVLILSAKSNESSHVRREVERAASKDITIVPFMIEKVTLSKSLEFFISKHHWLDATGKPVDRHVQALTDTVENLTRTRSTGAEPRTREVPGSNSSPGAGRAGAHEASVLADEDRAEVRPTTKREATQAVAESKSVSLDRIGREERSHAATEQAITNLDSSTVRENPHLLVGTRVATYLLQRSLGGGGTGLAYVAWDTKLARIVCIKLSYPLQADLDMVLDIASRGVRALSALDHPNLIKVWDFGPVGFVDGPSFYVVMEYVEGKTLDRWSEDLPDKVSSSSLRLAAAYELARALDVAHNCSYLGRFGFQETGLLHGDIKPANVIVRPDNTPVLLDFMMADVQRLLDPKIVQRSPTRKTERKTEAFGTVGFMPPEQEDQGIATVKSDVFSLGVTLTVLFRRELLSGGAAVCWDPLRILLAQMRSPNPDRRPQDMRQVAAVLCSISAAAGVRVRHQEPDSFLVAPWHMSRGLRWAFWRGRRRSVLSFVCPLCFADSGIKERDLGTTIRCPSCSRPFRLTAAPIEANWRPIAEALRKKAGVTK